MTPHDLDIFWRTIWGESRGEPLIGKIAVAHVLENRTLYDAWPNSMAEVCQQPWQFSCWNENDPNRDKMLEVSLAEESAGQCLLAAAEVIAGTEPDPTDGADHYMARWLYDGDRPSWADEMKVTAIIGQHVFLKS